MIFKQSNKTAAAIRGFTLTELMIGLAIGLFLVMIAGNLYLTTSRYYQLHATLAHLIHTAHITSIYLTDAIRRAGYSGDAYYPHRYTGSQIPRLHKPDCRTAQWTALLKPGITGSTSANAGYPCLNKAGDNRYLQGDILTSQFAGATPATRIHAEQIYIRNGKLHNAVFKGKHKLLPVNQLTPVLSLRQIHSYTYYVGTNKRHQCNHKPVPGLIRLNRTRSGRLRREMLVTGVENLKFEYLVQTRKKPARYQMLPANQVKQWQNVIAVRFWGIVRSKCVLLKHSQKHTYRFSQYQYNTDDRFLRRTFTQFVRIRNPEI